jgi:hypothetical protein
MRAVAASLSTSGVGTTARAFSPTSSNCSSVGTFGPEGRIAPKETAVVSNSFVKREETSASVMVGRSALTSSRRCLADIVGSPFATSLLRREMTIWAGRVASVSTARSAPETISFRAFSSSRAEKPKVRARLSSRAISSMASFHFPGWARPLISAVWIAPDWVPELTFAFM